MKSLILIPVFVIMTGCASISGNTQIVKVPVVTKCEPSVKVSSVVNYPFDKAKKEMSTFEKYQLASAERKLLRAENKELRAALSECTK